MADTRPFAWMRAVRDAVPKFSKDRQGVLLCLGLRMHSSGTGFASAKQLGEDVGVNERTARRATDEACARGYLYRTRRGHRLGNGGAMASEWKLLLPGDALAQPDTRARLSEISTGHSEHLNRTQVASQPDTGVRPRGLQQEVFSSSTPARAEQIIKTRTDATDVEASAAVARLVADRPDIRSTSAVLSRFTDEELAELVGRVRTEHTRADAAVWRTWAAGQPDCVHGTAGGVELHPIGGEPLCPFCRSLARKSTTNPITEGAKP